MTQENFDFIFITQTRWDDVSSTSFSLAQQFANSNRVFLVDKPYTWKDILIKRNKAIYYRLRTYLFGTARFRKIPATPANLTLVIPPPSVPMNWLPKGRVYEAFRRFNERQLFRVLRKAIKRYSVREYILFNSFNPNYSFNFPQDIRPSVKIYQCVDSIVSARYLSKHGVYREFAVAKQADVLLGTSLAICKRFKDLGFAMHYLPNAAGVKAFKDTFYASTEPPQELRSLNKPIIGYIGSIDDRIDYDIINDLARNHPEKAIVLVGPKRKSAGTLIGDNIICPGQKTMNELPLYAKYMDCTIIPFKQTEFTKSIYPLKINEYLAAGRPVVVTSFSPDIAEFKQIINIADNSTQFSQLVGYAIETDTRDRQTDRILFAEQNSWENRTAQFWKILSARTKV